MRSASRAWYSREHLIAHLLERRAAGLLHRCDLDQMPSEARSHRIAHLARRKSERRRFELRNHHSALDESERPSARRGPRVVGTFPRQILERLARQDAALQREEPFPHPGDFVLASIGRNGDEDVRDLAFLRRHEALRIDLEQGAKLVVVRLHAGGDFVQGDLQVAQAQAFGRGELAAVLLEVRSDLRIRRLGRLEVGGRNGEQ